MYNAYICRLKNVRAHPNADKLLLGDCFGNTVCVSLEYIDNQLGVYFPCDGQLSEEFCEQHNLVRKKDDAGNSIGGYMDPVKRNVTAIRLRGEKSDGLFMPLDSLAYTGIDITTLEEGFAFTAINGHKICAKYIPYTKPTGAMRQGNKTRKKKVPTAPLFAEHADTEQLAYHLSAFKPGDEIEITLKMHGTSQRTGYLPVLKGYKRTLWDRITRKEGTPIYDWGYVSGTRRVVLENYEGGFYGDNQFREQHSKVFEGKLWRGETAYYEVVSFTSDGTPIMGKGKVPKEAQAQYGKEMIFHYGLNQGSELYLYRMTFTSEEGYVIEYTPDLLRLRAEQMGIKTVPLFEKFIIPADIQDAGSYVLSKAEKYYDGPDPIGKTHVREGVVVRIINRPKFCAYKHKNFLFKQISGIITEQIVDTSNYTEDILTEL